MLEGAEPRNERFYRYYLSGQVADPETNSRLLVEQEAHTADQILSLKSGKSATDFISHDSNAIRLPSTLGIPLGGTSCLRPCLEELTLSFSSQTQVLGFLLSRCCEGVATYQIMADIALGTITNPSLPQPPDALSKRGDYRFFFFD
jgi:hypothetical protein